MQIVRSASPLASPSNGFPPLARLPTPAAGILCGRYQLHERIAAGGMAEVFRATRPSAFAGPFTFAIKRVRPELAGNPYVARRFLCEARITARLHHPNLVYASELGLDGDTPFLVLEHLDGRNLREVVREARQRGGRIAAGVALSIAEQVARGLAHAHELTDERGAPLGIVHRDVSLGNVMLLRCGGVKLVDFGIAEWRGPGGVPSSPGVADGKPAYMSPEQVRGEPLDARSDVFSLAVVLWELLTGRRLFASRDQVRALSNVQFAPIAPPSRHAPELPPAVDRVVLRALARERDERYARAADFADDLEELLWTVRLRHADRAGCLERLGLCGAAPARAPASPLPLPPPIAANAIDAADATMCDDATRVDPTRVEL